jgi:hypothetical protein
MQFITGEVAFSAITDPVRCLPSDVLSFYVVFLLSEEWFVTLTQPRLYDANRKSLPVQAIPVGSVVTLGLDAKRRIEAIQIVSLVDDCPFAMAA